MGDVSKWDKYMDRWEFIVKIDEFYKTFTGAMLILKPNNEFTKEKIKGEKER